MSKTTAIVSGMPYISDQSRVERLKAFALPVSLLPFFNIDILHKFYLNIFLPTYEGKEPIPEKIEDNKEAIDPAYLMYKNRAITCADLLQSPAVKRIDRDVFTIEIELRNALRIEEIKEAIRKEIGSFMIAYANECESHFLSPKYREAFRVEGRLIINPVSEGKRIYDHIVRQLNELPTLEKKKGVIEYYFRILNDHNLAQDIELGRFLEGGKKYLEGNQQAIPAEWKGLIRLDDAEGEDTISVRLPKEAQERIVEELRKSKKNTIQPIPMMEESDFLFDFERNEYYLSRFLNHYETALFLTSLEDRVHLFIDSKDFIKMLIGINAYEKDIINGKFPIFDRRDFMLAHLFNGYFGSFYLLIPHQKELNYNLDIWEKDQKTFNSEYTKNSIKNKLIDLKEQISGKNSIENIKSVVKELYELDYFSVLGWKQRLSKIYSAESSLLYLDEETFDYRALYNSTLFHDIRNGLEENREMPRSINNTDALSLTILAEKLKKFKQNPRTNHFPIFYDKNNFFRKILEKIDAKKHFIYTSPNGKNSFWILQSYSYFEIHNLIISWDQKDSLLFDELKLLKSQIKQKKRSGIPILDDTIISLTDSLTKLQNTYLVKLFWDQQESGNFHEFFQYIGEKIDSDVSEELNKASEGILGDIRKYTEHYSIATGVYNSIEPVLIKILKEKQLRNNLVEYRHRIIHFDPFLVFSLVKFSINNPIKKGVINLIEDIFINSQIDFTGVESVNPYTAYHKLIGLNDGIYSRIIYPLRDGVANNEDKNELIEIRQQLGQGLAVLWVLGKYDLIVDIFNHLENYLIRSNIFIYLSALVKQIRTYEDFLQKEERINSLVKLIESTKINGKESNKGAHNYKVALGLSSIYGELWQRLNSNSIKFNVSNPNPQPEKSKFDSIKFLNNIITLLENAKSWLEQDHRFMVYNHRRRYYYNIINDYIYYVTIALPNTLFKGMPENGAVEQLANAIGDETVWQPDFDYTLALVNLRIASINKQNGDRKGFNHAITEAQNRISKAISHVLKYDDYRNYVELKKQIYFYSETFSERQNNGSYQEKSVIPISPKANTTQSIPKQNTVPIKSFVPTFQLTFNESNYKRENTFIDFFQKTKLNEKISYQLEKNKSKKEYVVRIEQNYNLSQLYTLVQLDILEQELNITAFKWSNKRIETILKKSFEEDGGILKDLDLSNIPLKASMLGRYNLNQTKFIGCDLSNASMNEITAKNTNFHKAKLFYSRFIKAQLENCNFSEANLKEAEFSQAKINQCNFTDANLEETVFFRTNCKGSNFSGANLCNVDFRQANLEGVIFDGTDIEGVDFTEAYRYNREQFRLAINLEKTKGLVFN